MIPCYTKYEYNLPCIYSQTWTSGAKKWGGVTLNVKKILNTKKPNKSPDPIFWDEVNIKEEEKTDKSFTGLK